MKHLVILVIYTRLFLSRFSVAETRPISAEECERPEGATVLVEGQKVLISESNFPLTHSVHPPTSNRGHGDDSLDYFVLNKEKKVFYVKNFLNTSIAEELKDFCISGQRFKRSPIRGFGKDPSVTKNEVRTR